MNHDGTAEAQSRSGKKRVRATQACVLCRKKKIKCDGTKPECIHCQDANVQCEYTESKKRGPRKGYVQLLEERLALMEERLVRLGGSSALLSDSSEEPMQLRSLLSPSPFMRDSVPVPAPVHVPDDRDGLPPQPIVMHLVDLFFKFINSVYPLVHRATLRKSIEDGTVCKPLLWAVLAIAARFSDDPSIKTDPPYWAGERFAAKAASLIDDSTLEPTLPNLQFWGIMACIEYGRGSGSKSWLYAGIAVRCCLDLGLNKEETLSTPILNKDGTIDTVMMAMRRRIFWSCLCIDKFTSIGISRPQGFVKAEIDAHAPSIPESLVLQEPFNHVSASNKRIGNDSLMDIARHYMKMVELFGEVCLIMRRSRADGTGILWPPVPEYASLDAKLRAWRDNLPDRFQFTEKNLDFHRDNASASYFNSWLAMHAVWCSGLMVVHRGSLAYGDIRPNDVDADTYRTIRLSIDACKSTVLIATSVFQAMRDYCGVNVLPYMCYSAYVFATVLMTSTFSKGPEACRKSANVLKILYELIDHLRPYWPMCERLANTTQDLLVAHSRLYQQQSQSFPYDYKPAGALAPPTYTMATSTMPPSNTNPVPVSVPASRDPYPKSDYFMSPGSASLLSGLQPSPQSSSHAQPPSQSMPQVTPQPQQNFSSILTSDLPNSVMSGDIDFDSLDFLNDSALFGQIMFDVSRPTVPPVGQFPQMNYTSLPQQYSHHSSLLSANAFSPNTVSTPDASWPPS